MDDLGIVNAALLLIGAEKLGSLATGEGATKTEKLANTILDHCKKWVFDLPVEWKFARTRAELASTTDPVFGKYDHQYIFPNECRRILATVDEDDDEIEYQWRREVYIDGNNKYAVMLTSEDDVYIRYIVYISNPSMYPDWFSRLIIIQIALFLAKPVTEGQQRTDPLYTKLRDMWRDSYDIAKSANASEDADVNNAHIRDDKGNTDILSSPTSSLTGSETIIDRVQVLDTD